MNDDLHSYVATGHNRIHPDLCDTLVNRITNRSDWLIHDSEPTTRPNVLYSNDEERSLLQSNIVNILGDYQSLMKTEFLNDFSYIRFNRYHVGTTMSEHYDHSGIGPQFESPNKGIPVLSIVGNLNDEYEGADLVIRDKHYPMKKGDIIIFPSIFLYPHHVTECTKGIRYSFVSWAY